MARRPLEESVPNPSRRAWYDCHLCFVSVGSTIAETIAQSENPKVRAELEEYCTLHKRFRPSGEVALENCQTVFALQDGSSRFGPTDEAPGTGLMDIAQFASVLGQTLDESHRPAVAIISGNTCVRFRYPFESGIEMDGGLRMQWFNHSNDPSDPPDNNHVTSLRHRFPGTLISTRFSLDTELLNVVVKGNENN